MPNAEALPSVSSISTSQETAVRPTQVPVLLVRAPVKYRR